MFGGISNFEKKYEYIILQKSEVLVINRMQRKVKLNWVVKKGKEARKAA